MLASGLLCGLLCTGGATSPISAGARGVQIHTGKMAANSFLGADVDLWDLAQRTKNFSGAEIEGLVKSATSFALNRQVDVNDLAKPIDEANLKVSPYTRFESSLAS